MPNPLGALRNFLGSYPPTESFTNETYFRLVEILKDSWIVLREAVPKGCESRSLVE